MVVGSEAESLDVFVSPPPATVAVLVTLAGALLATFTVSVMARVGGSIGWADPDTRLAVAMTHNRMFRATTPEENPFVPIGEAVRKALGVSG